MGRQAAGQGRLDELQTELVRESKGPIARKHEESHGDIGDRYCDHDESSRKNVGEFQHLLKVFVLGVSKRRPVKNRVLAGDSKIQDGEG
jgi:hypothetical protein